MAPVITPAEKARLGATLSAIAAAQKPGERGRFRQARSGRVDEIAALGIAAKDQDSARALGVTMRVDEYEGPYGCGWSVLLRLVRDGKTWEMCHHVGPETWRGFIWREVPKWL